MTPERFHRLRRILDRRQPDLTVLMDRVHKPHNFSAVLRSCDAVGVFRAHIVPTEDFESRRHIASGVNRYVQVRRHPSLAAALEGLRQWGRLARGRPDERTTGAAGELAVGDAGGAAADPTGAAGADAKDIAILAAHPSDDAIDFRELDYTGPTAILLGTERDGLSAEGIAAADRLVAIPMVGAVTSLNVSVAAALILYEAQRQRAHAGLYDAPRLDPDLRRRTLFEWTYPKIARVCRDRGAPYPELGPDGEIVGVVPR